MNLNDKFKTCPDCDLRNRHEIAQDYYANYIIRLDSMFEWKGLPDTIPDYILERYLKINGWCGIGYAPENSPKQGLFCFFGGLGATPDEYYQPTQIILANPVLGSKAYEIGKDVVWARNDSLGYGVSRLLSRYSHLLAANDISINIAQVTSRIPFIITANDGVGIESAKDFIKDAEAGKIGHIVDESFTKENGVNVMPASSANSSNYLKSLIELHQYLKAQCSNDLGIGSNYNMKRERLTQVEAENSTPYLLPLVDEMLKFRQKICNDVNAMFGENWSVELSGAWKLEQESQKQAVEETSQTGIEESDDTNEV